MIRVAFTMIGGDNWTGGYNYLLNLVRALVEHASDRVQPVMFFGLNIEAKAVEPFSQIPGVTVVRHPVFDEAFKGKRLSAAMLKGSDSDAADVFMAWRIHVAFENAQFYGWRFPIPLIAWIPDFQHRYLKHLFDFKDYWKRELGFRAQVLSGRQIMLSSLDAKQDCERFYPSCRGRVHVVRFATSGDNAPAAAQARAVAESYGLPTTFFFLPNQFWKHKNHVCVIHALEILKARGKEVVVAASGRQMDPRDPDHFPKLKSYIETRGLETKFRLLGLIPHVHVPALMRACAALINPSLFEGWSTTVEEAKAMGTPMVLSSLRVHREQSDEASFFDPHSPEQLAGILERFVVADNVEREQKFRTAVQLATLRRKAFALEFTLLVEASSKPFQLG